ncbi:MAG TPA: hypothetical protein VHX37_11660 [Acidobacteriaceae bacterium]|jgi:hypothetical protein|nr:hypothetical protein [Acidobacteriaceae bacterium]
MPGQSEAGEAKVQEGSHVRPAPGTRAHADKATAQKPETSVHPIEPAGAGSLAQGGQRQNDALGMNVEGKIQAQPHPETPAGQHATGSFTGKKPESPRKRERKTA